MLLVWMDVGVSPDSDDYSDNILLKAIHVFVLHLL